MSMKGLYVACGLQMEDRATCLEIALPFGNTVFGFYGVYDGHLGTSAAQYVSIRLHGVLAALLRALPG